MVSGEGSGVTGGVESSGGVGAGLNGGGVGWGDVGVGSVPGVCGCWVSSCMLCPYLAYVYLKVYTTARRSAPPK